MTNSSMNTFLEMKSDEFERYSLDILKEQTKNLKNVKVCLDVLAEAYDGCYQLDGYIEFECMGIVYKTIVECKCQKTPIKREVVQKLNDTIKAVGANKGIVISASDFQSGAILYAQMHGIALIQLREKKLEMGQDDCRRIVTKFSHIGYDEESPYIGVLIEIGRDGESMKNTYLSPLSDVLENFLQDF